MPFMQDFKAANQIQNIAVPQIFKLKKAMRFI